MYDKEERTPLLRKCISIVELRSAARGQQQSHNKMDTHCYDREDISETSFQVFHPQHSKISYGICGMSHNSSCHFYVSNFLSIFH